MKFIEVNNWTPNISLSERHETIRRQLEEKGQNFEQLWQSGETEKIRELLQPGQWEEFLHYWQAGLEACREMARVESQKSLQQREQEAKAGAEEIERLLADGDVLQAAEMLRQADPFSKTPPIANNGCSPDQLLLMFKAKAMLEPVMHHIAKGKKFKPGRPKNSVSNKTKHINELATTHCNLSAKELYRLADSSILNEGKEMPFSTFEVKVSMARNPK